MQSRTTAVARRSEDGPDCGRWYTVIVEPRGVVRRTGYCAARCPGHGTAEEALAHHLQYQLDRETNFWLERRASSRSCEICGEQTTLRARLGRDTALFVLCTRHQTTQSLQTLWKQRYMPQASAATAAAAATEAT
jgi:hypothetical protein